MFADEDRHHTAAARQRCFERLRNSVIMTAPVRLTHITSHIPAAVSGLWYTQRLHVSEQLLHVSRSALFAMSLSRTCRSSRTRVYRIKTKLTHTMTCNWIKPNLRNNFSVLMQRKNVSVVYLSHIVLVLSCYILSSPVHLVACCLSMKHDVVA